MIELGERDLDLAAYERVVRHGEPVAITPDALARVDAGREAMLADLAAGTRAYGVTTGLGRLTDTVIESADQVTFQRALLVRGAGHGPALPDDAVRGAMLLRLTGFLAGHAGVSSALCGYLADRLNDGLCPWVPSRGITSAGEVIPLSHLFQALVGEGHARSGDGWVPSEQALADLGAEPYVPAVKEGIALVDGAPLAPALALSVAARSRRLVEHATLCGAFAIALSGGSLRPYSPRIGALARDLAQAAVQAEVLAWHAEAQNWDDQPQDPVSSRVLPQVHAAASEQLDELERRIEPMLAASTDSPLFLDSTDTEPGGFYPSGNFHQQSLSIRLDAIAIAMVQVANLGERRLARLLDPRWSRLPAQLATRPGQQTGLILLHKSLVDPLVEARQLAAPASVHPADTSGGQEDFQALALLAAVQAERVLDILELTLASELVAARQARHLCERPLPPRLEAVADRLASVIQPVVEDRSLSEDVQLARDLIATGDLLSL